MEKGIGGVIDGFPSGITIDEEFVQQELNRRRPGQSILTTPRKEADKVEFLSGILRGNQPGVLSVLSFGMKTNTPMTTTI